MTLRPWYRLVTNQADSAGVDLFIYDFIGQSFWDDNTVTAKSFVAELAALPKAVTTLRVHVNSPGGDVFDALAIFNALRAQRTEHGRTVEMAIEGLAASAATLITMAGDPIRIAKNGLVMVHNPHGVVMGTAEDMRKIAGLLDKVRDSILATYQTHSPLDAAALQALMDETTWMDAEEAIAKGFATVLIEDAVQPAARFRPAALAPLGAIPDAYRLRVEAWSEAPPVAPVPASPAEVLRACKAADLLDLAEPLLEAQAPMATVTARVDAAKAERVAAAERAREIRALCATAKLPALADGYLAGGMPVGQVKAQLTILTATLDQAEIDSGLKPDPERTARTKAALDSTAIYAARNQRGR